MVRKRAWSFKNGGLISGSVEMYLPIRYNCNIGSTSFHT